MGRYIGIPKQNMKIEMGKFPQYVALRKDGEFISPVEFEKYIAAYFEHDPKGRYSFRFINAGFVAEFIVILTLFPIFNFLLEIPSLSISLIMTALAVYVGYLVLSIGMKIKTRTPWGDFGGMWEISKPRSACIITLSIAAKIVLLLVSISLVYS
ncbi:hypothetical protein [Natribacillus halophilus]|nr:hypothetical protein [Natribacillus halophilus]